MPGAEADRPRAWLLGAWQAAVAAVSAPAVLPPALPPLPGGRLIIVAAGKAAATMTACAEAHYQPHPGAAISGLAITRHGHGAPTRQVPVREAGHPLPDAAGLAAARALLAHVTHATPDDHLLALLSGGGSSLLSLPLPGLELTDLRHTVAQLLASGAPIADLNCVRKHLGATLGGRLAAASAAPVSALLLSDVVGDDPSVIASGPFSPDPTTCADALAVLRRWRIDAPPAVERLLRQGHETPKPGAACFARVTTRIIGNGATALAGAAAWLRAQGVTVINLGDGFAGPARSLAQDMALRADAALAQRGDVGPPLALLSGGEAQVTVHGSGRGGRNSEFLLALALHTRADTARHLYALAADTDGIDGTGEHAGAILTPDTLERAAAMGLDARARLAANDSGGWFRALDDLLVTGPTRTNANDFRLLLLI